MKSGTGHFRRSAVLVVLTAANVNGQFTPAESPKLNPTQKAAGTDGRSPAAMSLFISPQNSSGGGITWGFGPVLLFPTATDDLLGVEKWGAGPTALALTVQGPLTVGMLGNHIWSYGGQRL